MVERRRIVMENTKSNKTFIGYFIGWCLYFSLSILGLQGRLSQLLLMVMVVWSFVYFFRTIKMSNLNPVLRTLTFLLSIFIVYGLVQLAFASGITLESLEYLKKAIISIVPIYGFYYLLKRIDISETGMILIIIALLLVAVGEYYSSRRELVELIAEGVKADRDVSEFVIGSSYRLLPIIPLLFFVKKDWLKYSVMAVILFYAILSIKRGPIFIGALCLVIFILDNLKVTSSRFRFSTILFTVLAVGAGYYMVTRLLQNNDFLLYRIEEMLEGDSSNRYTIYAELFNHITSETNPIIWLLGNGADSTLTIMGYYAHNDWLQIAFEQGLLGLIIYLSYYFQFIKIWRRTKSNHELHMCIALLLIITLISSFISMSVTNQRVTAHFGIAYCLALADNYLYKKKRTI